MEAPCPVGAWGCNPARALLAKIGKLTWSCNCPDVKTPFSLAINTIYVSSSPMSGRKDDATGIMKTLNLFTLTVRIYTKKYNRLYRTKKI